MPVSATSMISLPAPSFIERMVIEPPRGEFDGVLDQVPEHLLKTGRVRLDMEGAGGKVEPDFEMLRVDVPLANLECAMNGPVGVDRPPG